jgi:hypothetical protein
MKQIFKLFTYSCFLLFLTSCGQIFEVDADVQARQALLDLMQIQDKFYQENKRYATGHAEIEKYNLNYHTGIVYLEIENAGKDGYRAVSLPAESTTARVFAYDSKQGGFYEMEQEEVSRYVLGALKHIRDEKHKNDLNELTGWLLMGGMTFLGLRFFFRYRSPENNIGVWSYILSLPAMGWAVALLGKMEGNVVFTKNMAIGTWAGLTIALLALGLGTLWVIKNKKSTPAPLVSLLACTLFISFASAGVMLYVLKTFG